MKHLFFFTASVALSFSDNGAEMEYKVASSINGEFLDAYLYATFSYFL